MDDFPLLWIGVSDQLCEILAFYLYLFCSVLTILTLWSPVTCMLDPSTQLLHLFLSHISIFHYSLCTCSALFPQMHLTAQFMFFSAIFRPLEFFTLCSKFYLLECLFLEVMVNSSSNLPMSCYTFDRYDQTTKYLYYVFVNPKYLQNFYSNSAERCFLNMFPQLCLPSSSVSWFSH